MYLSRISYHSFRRLNPTGLSNEFFNRACTEWKERLAEGEFTPENQQKRKLEVEREKNKLDPWKVNIISISFRSLYLSSF